MEANITTIISKSQPKERDNNRYKGTASFITGILGTALINESRKQISKGNDTAGILLLCTGAFAHLLCIKLLIDIKKEDNKIHQDRLTKNEYSSSIHR